MFHSSQHVFSRSVFQPHHIGLWSTQNLWRPAVGAQFGVILKLDFGHRISDDMDFIETMVTQKSIQKSIQSQLADLCFPLKSPFADSIFRQTHMSIDFLNLKQGHARNLIQSFDMIRSWTKNCQWENHGIWRDPIELRNDIWMIHVYIYNKDNTTNRGLTITGVKRPLTIRAMIMMILGRADERPYPTFNCFA